MNKCTTSSNLRNAPEYYKELEKIIDSHSVV